MCKLFLIVNYAERSERVTASIYIIIEIMIGIILLRKIPVNSYNQGPDLDDMSSFFPCEIDNAIQYINVGYGAQASKIVNLQCILCYFQVLGHFCNFIVIFLSYFQGLLHFEVIFSSLTEFSSYLFFFFK